MIIKKFKDGSFLEYAEGNHGGGQERHGDTENIVGL